MKVTLGVEERHSPRLIVVRIERSARSHGQGHVGFLHDSVTGAQPKGLSERTVLRTDLGIG